MVARRGTGDFTQVYRPCRLSEVVGNERAKRILENAFKKGNIPHNILFYGLSGTGKTTLARIIEMGLNCEKGPTCEPCCECRYCKSIISRKGNLAVREINAVEEKKDDLIKILKDFDAYGFGGIEGSRKSIFLVDECHGLTQDQAQLFLKYTEDVHEDNYFIFCTTEPKKVLKTLRDRCALQIKFDPISDEDLRALLRSICGQELIEPKKAILDRIILEAEGKPRVAIRELYQSFMAGDLSKRPLPKIVGRNNLIIVAPHAASGPNNDDFVGTIAKQIQSELGCYALINDCYSRENVDFNSIRAIKSAGLESEFLTPLRDFKNKIIAKGLKPLIVFIHGIMDANIEKIVKTGAKILIGYGQGRENDDKIAHRPTLSTSDLETLEKNLNLFDLSSQKAPVDSDYCARKIGNLNQLFMRESRHDYYDPKVRSFQLEIAKRGLRGNKKEAQETGKRLASALKAFVENIAVTLVPVRANEDSTQPSLRETKPDEKLVSETYEYLKGIVQRHFHRAMLEAGTYIIEKFFDGDFERARNPRNAEKIHSLNELVRRLQGNDGNGPSKTWVYNAVKLAVDEHKFEGFSVYGKLGLSHKVYLTHVKSPEAKQQLIQEAVENNYTVAQTRERIAEIRKNGHHEKLNLVDLPEDFDFEMAGRDELLDFQREARSKIELHQSKLAFYKKRLDAVTKALNSLASKRNAPSNRSKVIELSSSKPADVERKNRKRKRGTI